MQEIEYISPEGRKIMREFFQAQSQEDIIIKMDKRVEELAATAEVLRVKREKVELNKRCPCGSGRKFKNCCLRNAK